MITVTETSAHIYTRIICRMENYLYWTYIHTSGCDNVVMYLFIFQTIVSYAKLSFVAQIVYMYIIQIVIKM